MVKRDQYAVAGLLGIAAIAVLWHLSRQSSAAVDATTPITDEPVSAGLPSYPSPPEPIKLGDIAIGGSPVNLTYNQLPGGQNSLPTYAVAPVGNVSGSAIGACGCDEDKCAAGGPVSVLSVSPIALQRAYQNFKSFSGAPGASAPVAGAGKVVS